MKKQKKRFKKNNQRRQTYRTVLESTIKKNVKKNIIHEVQDEVRIRINNRDRNLRMLMKNRFPEQSSITKAYKRNIIANQNAIQRGQHFLICKKRAEKRRMIFAQKRAGKGISGPKIKRLTPQSKVRC